MNRWGVLFPSLHHRKEARAASSIKCRGATTADEVGVVYLVLLNRKTTPSSRSAEASRHLIDRSATPPCGGARRGILLDSNSFTSSMTADNISPVESPALGFAQKIGQVGV